MTRLLRVERGSWTTRGRTHPRFQLVRGSLTIWEAAWKSPTQLVFGRPPQSAPGRAPGPHSPIKGILVGVGHVHDVNEAAIPCREQVGHGKEAATPPAPGNLGWSRAF